MIIYKKKQEKTEVVDNIIDATSSTTTTATNNSNINHFIIYKHIHAFCMILSWIMVLGAGVMFTRRSANLISCHDLYAIDDQFIIGATLIEDPYNPEKWVIGLVGEENITDNSETDL